MKQLQVIKTKKLKKFCLKKLKEENIKFKDFFN